MMRSALAALLLTFLAFSAVADDGMWMPQQIPALGAELKKLGLQIDPNSFADLTGFPMGAIVQISGCSASFVSPQGLIATNHHCAYGSLQYNATPQNDIVRNGFLAKAMKDEIAASPDMRVYVTTNIEDVTKQVLAAFPKNTSDADRTRLITRRRRELIAECEKPGNLRCSVPSFFEGAQYLRITQRELRDVRIVYAPPLGVGNFGDEVDNWMWPRHTGDFAFFRAYDNGVPFQPKHWLKISTRDLDDGDLIMLAGFPGITHRHRTFAEVDTAAAIGLPNGIRYRKMLVDLLQERGKESREIALKNASRIASLENIQKKYTGTMEAFRRASILDAKKRDEAAIRGTLDAKLGPAYDAAHAELLKIFEEDRRTAQRNTLFEWLYTASPMLTQADRLYKLSVERTKADLDRDEDFTERNRRRLQSTVTRARRNIEPGSDRAGLRLFLVEVSMLPADQRIAPVDAAIAAAGSIDALLNRIYASTKIGDAATEEKMFEESTAQLTARRDSMIDFAASLRPFKDALETHEKTRAGAMSRLRPVMLDALRVARGGRLYPDANATLRVGFGVVKGYAPRNAVWYVPQTDVRGLAEKETGEEPFASPPKLLQRAAARSFGPYADPDLGTMPVAFISTNIVTNGHSGSATLNAWGELCGLAYDSNWEGVGSDYMVEEDITRTIAVDSRYMLWVMDAVDGAHNVLRELGIEPRFAD